VGEGEEPGTELMPPARGRVGGHDAAWARARARSLGRS